MLHNSFTFNFNKKALFGFYLISTTLCILYSFSFLIKKVDSNYIIGSSICNITSHVDDADVIIMGCSRSHQGIDPRILARQLSTQVSQEVKVSNFARPGMQAPFFYYILLDYLQSSKKKPKAVVINLSFYLLGGMDWMEDIYFSYYSPKLWQVLDAISTNLRTYDQAFQWYLKPKLPFLMVRKKFKTGVLEQLLSPKDMILNPYLQNRFYKQFQFDSFNKGYLSRGSEKINENEDFSSFKEYKTGGENGYKIYLDYLERFFELALKYDFKIIVYEFPWPAKGRDENLEDVIDYYESIIKKAADGNPNVIFIKNRYFWDTSLFADPLHLNQKGAEKLTNIVVEWVKSFSYTTKLNDLKE